MSFVLAKKFRILGILRFMTRKDFMVMWVEHEKSFITLGQIRLSVYEILLECLKYVVGHQKIMLLLTCFGPVISQSGSLAQFENRIKPRVYVRRITRSKYYV